jgi:hypothetical protein
VITGTPLPRLDVRGFNDLCHEPCLETGRALPTSTRSVERRPSRPRTRSPRARSLCHRHTRGAVRDLYRGGHVRYRYSHCHQRAGRPCFANHSEPARHPGRNHPSFTARSRPSTGAAVHSRFTAVSRVLLGYRSFKGNNELYTSPWTRPANRDDGGSVCAYLSAHICLRISVCAYLSAHICLRISVCAYLSAHICLRISVCAMPVSRSHIGQGWPTRSAWQRSPSPAHTPLLLPAIEIAPRDVVDSDHVPRSIRAEVWGSCGVMALCRISRLLKRELCGRLGCRRRRRS